MGEVCCFFPFCEIRLSLEHGGGHWVLVLGVHLDYWSANDAWRAWGELWQVSAWHECRLIKRLTEFSGVYEQKFAPLYLPRRISSLIELLMRERSMI